MGLSYRFDTHNENYNALETNNENNSNNVPSQIQTLYSKIKTVLKYASGKQFTTDIHYNFIIIILCDFHSGLM